ncbi:MAG: hypothetical protein ACI4KI_04585 [Candidatus Fimenecus sp.]
MKVKDRSILISIIAVMLAAVLMFSQALIGSAADAVQSGDTATSVIRSNAACLTATEEELKELDSFLGTVFYGADETLFEINSKELTYEVFLNKILTDMSGKSVLYGEYFNGSEAIEYEKTPDPMKRFAADKKTKQTGFYYKYTKENLDWILTKIFNVSPSVTVGFNPEGYDNSRCYYYDGCFYISGRTGAKTGDFAISVKSWQQYENGRYIADVESVPVNGKGYASSLKTVLALKEISGVRRWTIYYAGEASGVEEALKNEPLTISVDNNSFLNNGAAFITYAERTRYYTNGEEIKKLTENKPENLKNALYEYIAGGWDGSGYGISMAMALSFAGKIDISQYQDGQGISFYKMQQPSQNNKFRALINYYQVSQLFRDFSDYVYFDDDLGKSEKTAVLKSLIETVKSDSPVIIGCRWKSNGKAYGHTLVGCGYSGNQDGSYNITLVDPDTTNKHIYLSVSKDFTECSFNGSSYDNGKIVSLGYITADRAQTLLETDISQKAEKLADKCIFIIEQNAVLTITNDSGQKLIHNENGFSGDMNYTVENYILTGNNHQSDMLISVDNSESFTVENEGTYLDITVSGSNGIFCGVDGMNIETVNIIPGEFTIKGKDMAYSVSALSSEEDVNLINLRGGESKALTVMSKDGVSVISKRKQNLRIALISANGEIKECDYQPQDFEYSITQELIEEHVEMEKTNHIRVLLFFGMFGVLVVSAAAVTVVTVRKKRKKNKKENETE